MLREGTGWWPHAVAARWSLIAPVGWRNVTDRRELNDEHDRPKRHARDRLGRPDRHRCRVAPWPDPPDPPPMPAPSTSVPVARQKSSAKSCRADHDHLPCTYKSFGSWSSNPMTVWEKFNVLSFCWRQLSASVGCCMRRTASQKHSPAKNQHDVVNRASREQASTTASCIMIRHAEKEKRMIKRTST